MAWTNENGRKCFLETANILESLDIPYFLIQGTALGAYRDHGFTPTEKDIDIGILQEHMGTMARRLVDVLMLNQFQIETWLLPFHQIRTIVAWKYGVHADLVGFIKYGDLRFMHTPVHPSVPKPYALVHNAKLLENYQQVKAFDHIFNVPSPIEEYLEVEYGSNWRTPKDDHESRTRIYSFVEKRNIPHDLLPPQS